MRILATVRQVLDAEENVIVKDGRIDTGGNKLVVDTMDEYGVEEALRLREAAPGTEVVALAVGASRLEEALRTALAMGADRAILVEGDTVLDVIATSKVVAEIAKAEQADLIFCGGQQADWGQSGPGRGHGGAARLAAVHMDELADGRRAAAYRQARCGCRQRVIPGLAADRRHNPAGFE